MSEIGAHVGEDAELYALGQLGELERVRVERHVARCGECARRIGEAETTVLRLIEAQPSAQDAAPLRPLALGTPKARSYAPWFGAVAAAFVLGLLLPWGVATVRDRAVVEQPQQLADTAMLNGHFLHAALVPIAPGAPAAKVIYARRGGWLYVLVAPGTQPLDVVLVSGAARSTAATIAPGDATRKAFVRQDGRFDAVELDENGKPVSSVKLVYAAR